jgi:hypothetical protein
MRPRVLGQRRAPGIADGDAARASLWRDGERVLGDRYWWPSRTSSRCRIRRGSDGVMRWITSIDAYNGARPVP